MRVGGPARFFLSVKNREELEEAVFFADSRKLPLFVLGGGSNIVVSDRGFHGVVVRPDIRGIHIEDVGDAIIAIVGAGEHWDSFVESIVARNIFSIENLSAIPGTVGAAPVQNIGAYGVEIKDFIRHVDVFDTYSRLVKKLERDACEFSYRDSIFKKPSGSRYIIIRVVFAFPKRGTARFDYKDVFERVKEKGLREAGLTPALLRKIIVDIRTYKLPDVKKMGTVGSFFKNPIISKEKFTALSHIYAGMPGHETRDGKIKIPLAWIIDVVCQKKGFRRGNVGVYDKQALVIVNYGGSTAEEIKNFAHEIQDDVRRRTGIEVEFEISFVGEF